MSAAVSDPKTYANRGVSANKPDVKLALHGIDPGLFPKAFCKAVPDILSGSSDHCVLLHSDGSGSKVALAYIHYLRHGDANIFKGIAQDSLVMNLDDLACVGAMGPFVYSNTIGRNGKKVPGDVVRAIIHGYEEFAERLGTYGIDVRSCGGETADLGDLVRTLVVDSSVVARMRRSDFIDCNGVKAGHSIVGLASAGKARYETSENSGVGSNGFTALRHCLLKSSYREEFPETFAPEISEHAYTGSFDIDDFMPGSSMTIGEACLSPTRTYLPVLKLVLDECRSGISGIFHNTGGGLTKCLGFGQGVRYIKDDLFSPPALFLLAQTEGNISLRELVQIFNMGHRLEIVCDSTVCRTVIAISQTLGVDAKIIGRVEEGDGNSLSILLNGTQIEFSDLRS